jgi:hypothetical protein
MFLTLKRPVFIALAMALSAGGAPETAQAMAGGGARSVHADAWREGRSHNEVVLHRGGANDGRFHGGQPHGGAVFGGGWRDDYYRDHRLEGLFFGGGGWPLQSLILGNTYGAGDFQPCIHRDVYGDLYQAC